MQAFVQESSEVSGKGEKRVGFRTWLKNSVSKQSIHGSATSMGRASLEISATFTSIIRSYWLQSNLVFYTIKTIAL